MLEPLGESQVVAYLERLAGRWPITLISFEKEDPWRSNRAVAIRTRLERVGIQWKPCRYHRRPLWLAKIADVTLGSWEAWRSSAGRHHVTIHARGYLPALMALPARRLAGAKLVFDIRGFWADERVDRGHWPRGGITYGLAKWLERRLFSSADAIVSLTHAAVRSFPEIGHQPKSDVPVRVIPTCVDLHRFRPGPKAPALVAAHGLARMTVIGCVGTLSRAYMRDEMLRYMAILAARLPQCRIVIVTHEDHERLRLDAAGAGLEPERLVLVRASHSDMPELVRLIDVGVFFIRPCFSARAAAATKLGEFLATGVPIVTTDGVGDSSDLIRRTGTGLVLRDVSAPALEATIPAVMAVVRDAAVRQRCRETAERYFDIDAGAAEYSALYETLAS